MAILLCNTEVLIICFKIDKGVITPRGLQAILLGHADVLQS